MKYAIMSHYCDEVSRPDWGEGPDGKAVKITDDQRLPSLFAAWKADACVHDNPIIIKRTNRGGAVMFNNYCPHCGGKSSQIPHSDTVGKTVSIIDDAAIEAVAISYSRDRANALGQITSAAAERCQSGNRAAYDDYLRSDAWQRRAAKIKERAGGTCEGCLSRPAVDVHHLTYANIGNEFAFELVALCSACHARIHNRSAA